MTGTQPTTRQPRSPRVRLAAVGLVGIAALAVLGVSNLGDSLVYYRTPTELLTEPTAGDVVRLGGLVAPGSVTDEGGSVRFTLTDGASDVEVVHRGDPPGVFQEGQGALVEGAVDGTGVFRSELLIVKHSNEYVAEDGDAYEVPDSSGGDAAREGAQP